MDWRIKGAIQKVLGKLPGGDRMHYVLQWLGPLGGVLFRRGRYRQYYR